MQPLRSFFSDRRKDGRTEGRKLHRHRSSNSSLDLLIVLFNMVVYLLNGQFKSANTSSRRSYKNKVDYTIGLVYTNSSSY